MQTNFEQYDLKYLIDQFRKMSVMNENEECIAKDKIAKMKKAFKSFDKDGNGVLDRKEILGLLQLHFKEEGIKRKPNKDDVEQFFDSIDDDKSGTIEFAEFKKFLIENMKHQLLTPLATYLENKGIDIDHIC
jgi:Ca2+-binding EF-hand superfamily protein